MNDTISRYSDGEVSSNRFTSVSGNLRNPWHDKNLSLCHHRSDFTVESEKPNFVIKTVIVCHTRRSIGL